MRRAPLANRATPVRRRKFTRRTAVQRPIGKLSNRIVQFKRGKATTVLACTDTINAGVFQFKLADLPDASEFLALYDQYKLTRCVAGVRWAYNGPTGEQEPHIATMCAPNLHWCIDHDDLTAIASVDAMCQYDTHKRVAMKGQTVYWTVTPTYLTQAWVSSIATGYGPRTGWLSTTYTTVPHFGIKWILDGSLNGGAGTHALGNLYVDWTYYLLMRSVK